MKATKSNKAKNSIPKEKNSIPTEDDKNILIISKKKALLLLFLCGLLVVLCIASIAIMLINPFEETIDVPDFSGWEELTYLERPTLNFVDGQSVLLEDLQVQWNNCSAADFYKYNIILLEGEPDYGNDNESEKDGSIILAQNKEGTADTSVLIPKESLKPEKWIKIAVASCQTDFELWECVYVYIKNLE